MIRGGCEIVVHGILMMLDLHLNWVVIYVDVCNTFNLMSWLTIFQELRSLPNSLDQFFPFV
jgi:hypothetical protein